MKKKTQFGIKNSKLTPNEKREEKEKQIKKEKKDHYPNIEDTPKCTPDGNKIVH